MTNSFGSHVGGAVNRLFVNAPTDCHNPTCAELITMVERELAALFTAVTELFGSEQARLSSVYRYQSGIG